MGTVGFLSGWDMGEVTPSEQTAPEIKCSTINEEAPHGGDYARGFQELNMHAWKWEPGTGSIHPLQGREKELWLIAKERRRKLPLSILRKILGEKS